MYYVYTYSNSNHKLTIAINIVHYVLYIVHINTLNVNNNPVSQLCVTQQVFTA